MLTSHYFVRLSLLYFCCFANSGVFAFELNEKLTKTDAVLITKSNGESIFEWQVDKQLIPASLTKLTTCLILIVLQYISNFLSTATENSLKTLS